MTTRSEARAAQRRRDNQEQRRARSAFRARITDRRTAGSLAAMRRIYEGKVPHATAAMVASVRKTVASIRAEDAELAERLFGPEVTDHA